MCVNGGFSGWAFVGMTYGIEYTFAVSKVGLGTVVTAFLHNLQLCIFPEVFLKAIWFVDDEHIAFKREPAFGVNHWLKSCGDLDEVSMFVGLEMTYSCLATNFKVMSINRKPKWYLKLLDKANFLTKIDIGNSIKSDLVGLSWKCIVSGHLDWKRINNALNMVLTNHISYLNSYEDFFTSTLSACVYISLSCASIYYVVVK